MPGTLTLNDVNEENDSERQNTGKIRTQGAQTDMYNGSKRQTKER